MATRVSWLNDVPQQFQDKRNIEILIKAFERQLNELEAVFSDLDTKTDLDSAVGVNLDNVGGIVGLTRKEAGLLAGPDTVPPVMSDERYRQFLKYKTLVNTNECTYYDLMDGLSLLWDISPIYYIEDPALPAVIILTMPFLKPGGEVVRLGEVPMVKPSGVRIDFQYKVKVTVETLARLVYLSYDVPRCNQIVCGTWPRRATLGKAIYVEMNVEAETLAQIFTNTQCGTIRIGGTAYRGTTGQVLTDDVEIAVNIDDTVSELVLAGQIVSGTYPRKAVNGVVLGTEILTGRTVSHGHAEPPLSGTRTSGGGSMQTANSQIVRKEVQSAPCVVAGAGISKKCGSDIHSNIEISTAVDVTPKVSSAAVVAKHCGTSRCGKK